MCQVQALKHGMLLLTRRDLGLGLAYGHVELAEVVDLDRALAKADADLGPLTTHHVLSGHRAE